MPASFFKKISIYFTRPSSNTTPIYMVCDGSNVRELSIGYQCYERPMRVAERDYRRRYGYIERSNTTALSTMSRCIE